MPESATQLRSGRLLGKSAVVTGAAAGIGRATAELFAREGARLVLADINADGLSALRDSLQDVTADVTVVTADVSKPEDVRRMIEVAVEDYGRLDIAIANAGIIPLASVVEATLDDWDEVMAIDGRGMFLTCKYAIEQMMSSGGGSIVCLVLDLRRSGPTTPVDLWSGEVRRLWPYEASGCRMGRQRHPALMQSRRERSTPSGCSGCQRSRVERSI